MTTPSHSGNNPNGGNGTMLDQAIHWLLKQRAGDMDVAEWENYTLWLEQDPRHAALLDKLLESDEAVDQLVPEQAVRAVEQEQPETLVAANDNPFSRFIPWVMTVAAALALAFFAWPGGTGVSGNFITEPGEIRTIALTDEISMTLNGDSAVSVSEGEPVVDIDRGEVAFAINSDQPEALRVNVADLVLTDYGTIFNVALNDRAVSISVAEGVVAVNPDAEAVQVSAGQQITKAFEGGGFLRNEVASETVGTWREGRLEFDDTPIADALLQLQRSTGLEVEIAGRYSSVRLTGSLQTAGPESDTLDSLADIIGGTASKNGDSWTIE